MSQRSKTEKIILIALLTGIIWYFYWPFYKQPEQIQFYYRAGGSNNGWETSFDYLKITNYTNGSVTAKQLYQYAQQYVDTAYAEYPVSKVTFVGHTSGGTLPYDIAEDMFGQVQRQSLISFDFSNAFPQEMNAEKKLIGVDLFEGGVSINYDNTLEGKEKKAIHNILTSDKPLDNGFTSLNPLIEKVLITVFWGFVLLVLVRFIAGTKQFHTRRNLAGK